MSKVSSVMAAMVLLSCALPAAAEVLLSDNFDQYPYDANLATFRAAWTSSGSAGGVLLTGAPNKSVIVYAGVRSDKSFQEFAPTAQEDLQISFKISGGGSATRQHIDLIDGAGSESGQLLQLGMHEAPPGLEYSVRMLGSVEADSFVFMDPAAPNRSSVFNQWTELKAVIHRESDSTASAKIYVNDVLAKSLSGFDLRSYDTVRIGANVVPSSSTSVLFDDVLVQTVPVPEPTAVGTGVTAALTLCRRRRRRLT